MRKSKVNNFKQFLEGSGAPFFGDVGPMYGRPKFPSTGLSLDTITYDGKVYMLEDYQELLNDFINSTEYDDYIRNGGKPLNDFTLDNIITIKTKKPL
jgi:hypothetical protein